VRAVLNDATELRLFLPNSYSLKMPETLEQLTFLSVKVRLPQTPFQFRVKFKEIQNNATVKVVPS